MEKHRPLGSSAPLRQIEVRAATSATPGGSAAVGGDDAEPIFPKTVTLDLTSWARFAGHLRPQRSKWLQTNWYWRCCHTTIRRI